MHPLALVVYLLALQSLLYGRAHAQSGEDEERTRPLVTRHPYMAAIRNHGRFDCAGILIKEQIVLTTARCVDPRYDRDELPEIWLNSTRTHEPGDGTIFRKAIDVRVHPLYSGDIFEGHDFALLLLNASAHELDYMGRFPPSVPVEPGRELSILGHGRSSGTDAIAPYLQIGQLTIVSPEVCHNSEDIVFIEDQMFCVEGNVPCNGDQGGPIFNNGDYARTDYLVGIISIASCEYNPRVAAFLSTHNLDIYSWIDEQVAVLEALAPEEDISTSDCTLENILELAAQGSEVAWEAELDCLM